MVTKTTHTHAKLWTDQGTLWLGQPVKKEKTRRRRRRQDAGKESGRGKEELEDLLHL